MTLYFGPLLRIYETPFIPEGEHCDRVVTWRLALQSKTATLWELDPLQEFIVEFSIDSHLPPPLARVRRNQPPVLAPLKLRSSFSGSSNRKRVTPAVEKNSTPRRGTSEVKFKEPQPED